MEDNKEKNLNKVFGNNIKMLRQYKMALSQKETARRLGISLRTYTRAETGQADVSITMARMCSDFFGVTMSSLCGNFDTDRTGETQEYEKVAAEYVKAPEEIQHAIRILLKVKPE